MTYCIPRPSMIFLENILNQQCALQLKIPIWGKDVLSILSHPVYYSDFSSIGYA